MDKRFFLALVLAALVLIVGQMLSPSPKRQATVPTKPDSGLVAAESARASGASATTRGATTTVTPTASARPDSVIATAARSAPTPAAGDTITITTPKVVYRFSTVGAAPIAATLAEYRALSAADGPVQLARRGAPLVEYRLRLGSDTIPLDRL